MIVVFNEHFSLQWLPQVKSVLLVKSIPKMFLNIQDQLILLFEVLWLEEQVTWEGL